MVGGNRLETDAKTDRQRQEGYGQDAIGSPVSDNELMAVPRQGKKPWLCPPAY